MLAECRAGAGGDGCSFVSANATTVPAIKSSNVTALGGGGFRVTLNGTGLLGAAANASANASSAAGVVNASLHAAGVKCTVQMSAATTFVCSFPGGGEAGAHDLLLRVPG